MQILFGKTKWEKPEWSLEHFLDEAAKAGFGAVELHVALMADVEPEALADMAEAKGLRRIAMITTGGPGKDDQCRELDEGFATARRFRAEAVNCHGGKDFLPFEDNVEIMRRGMDLAGEAGLALTYETHRGRPLYSLPETERYLEALPDLRLNADFSHWMAVHESDLEPFGKRLDPILERCDYIHARVGYAEGPQVTDPRAPEWRGWLDRHIALWRRLLDAARKRGREDLLITPEFGPPPYAHSLPYVNRPIADVWDVNVFMKKHLERELA